MGLVECDRGCKACRACKACKGPSNPVKASTRKPATIPQSSPYQTPPYQTPPHQTPPYQTPPYQSAPYQSPPWQPPPYQTPPYQSAPYQSPPWQPPPHRTLPDQRYALVACSTNEQLQREQDLVQTKTAQDHRIFSRPTPGDALVQAMKENQYNYLFNSINLTTTYQAADGSKTTEQADIPLNPKAVQCGLCWRGFHTKEAYYFHKKVYSSGCVEHGVCFGTEENVIHAKRYEHDSCFVTGCTSEYREEEGWEEEEIMRHVKKAHGLQGRKE